MKIVALFVILFSYSGYLQAQEPASFDFAFNHMAMSVKDVDRAAEFYLNVLKLKEITNRSKIEGIRWFAFGQGGDELHLISVVKENVITNKALHLALTTSNFDAFVERLNARSIPYSDWPGSPNKVNIRADGIKQIFFQDPDGNWIEVNSIGSTDGKN